MSIKNIAGLKTTLQNANIKDWTRSVEIGKQENFHPSDLQEVKDTEGIQKTFGDFLKDSLNEVNSLQVEANTAMERVASGNSKNLHETLLAVEKADIAFRSMNQIRTKVIDAYKEIMKMQI